ncbi:polymerase protein [Chrysanthemum yellow dwarf virus]|uniref:Replicase n=1 Tax=chrysanthemum yellow dwarf associated virus TaxID=3070829 RepID=A0AAE7UFY5_9RHAB|nr:polymerase protein [Chrysanthemum yellow dwarf virus]QRX38982.1 polymerase protein [Chrysanthemum yellow dwarf virus]
MDFISILENSGENKAKNSVPLPDYHLRNPVQPILWLNDQRRRSARHRYDLAQLNRLSRTIQIGNHIDLFLRFRDVSSINDDQKAWDDSMYVLKNRLDMDHDALRCLSKLEVLHVLSATQEGGQVYWKRVRYWGKVLLIMNALSSNRDLPEGVVRSNGGVMISLERNLQLFILKTCVAVYGPSRECTIYDGDWVRMTSDIWTQRHLLVTAAHIGRVINQQQYPSLDIIERIVAWGDELLSEFKNDGYRILKTYEAVIIGVIQSRGESRLIKPDQFLENTINDLSDTDPFMGRKIKELREFLDDIQNVHHLTQLYGLYRAWGHPMVDSVAGMIKTEKIGKKDIIRDMSLSDSAGCMFKRLFCKGYKGKFGHYPQIVDPNTPLSASIALGEDTATDLAVFQLHEWKRIKFRKTFQLPETFNLSMIVADKSISPTRSELVNIINRTGTVMDPDKRRGVKRWLEDETINPKEFLEEVEKGEFPDDHKIIGLTPKERELNPVPRMFALMSHLLRVYVVLTEQLLSDHILKMFPQITMTDSLLELTKKMYSTVRSQSVLNKRRGKDRTWASRVVCMSLDFEKWNGHMRKEMTTGVFTPLGDLFGLTELYNNTYDIFSECYYYLADGSYTPTCDGQDLRVEGPFSFVGHKGGMEGLRQKGWTIFTVCGLEVILSSHDCNYKIMGMGDNQVLQVTLYTSKVDENGFPTKEGECEMKKELDLIFSDLVRMFTSAGLPLKPLETWMSEDLYLYGKVPIWKGVPLPMDLKKIMRMFHFSNADVMTIENALGTISSNALAATQSSMSIIPSYVMCLLQGALCARDFLQYHPLLGKGMVDATQKKTSWSFKTMSGIRHEHSMLGTVELSMRDMALVITLIPRTLMGYNGINILEMMMRGFPDNLSRDISYLLSIVKSPQCRGWLREVVLNWVSPIYMPEINYSTLVKDITGVNILSPRSPSSGIKQAVEKYMTSGVNIRNTEFRDLMSAKDKVLEEKLSSALCEGKELHIRLLHDVMESTIYGYVDSVLSKVTKTTTIQRLAMRATEHDVYRTICDDETTYFLFFRWRNSKRGDPIDEDCATCTCKQIRSKGWNKILRGVTIPHPHSFMSHNNCHLTNICLCEDGCMSVILPDTQIPNNMWYNTLGSSRPYLGSITKEKVVVGTGGKVYSSEPLIKRPINLLRTINWFVPEDSTCPSFNELVAAVTDMDPTIFIGVSEGIAGEEVHRYKDSSMSHGALTSSSYLLSTRYHVSSDSFSRYCRNSENTDLHFQALYCYIVEYTNMMMVCLLNTEELIPRFLHFKQTCYKCISPVKEDFVDLECKRVVDMIPSKKSNRYLYVNQDSIKILETRSPLSRLSGSVMTNVQYREISPEDKRLWLEEIISDKILSHIVSEEAAGSELDDHNLNMVGEYERTMYLNLDPKRIIMRVLGNITLVSEWIWLKSTGHTKRLSIEEIKRIGATLLKGASQNCFLGLSMFYCWPTSAEKLTGSYPEIVIPDTNPITLESANEAIRCSLLSLFHTNEWKFIERSSYIAEDEKNNITALKIKIYTWLKGRTNCIECKRTILNINGTTISKVSVVRCKEGHKPYEHMVTYPWIFSQVTMERLRKDSCGSQLAMQVREQPILPHLTLDFVELLLNQAGILKKPEHNTWFTEAYGEEFPPDWYCPTEYHLFSAITMPTRTRSKLIPIVHRYRRQLFNNQVFVMGDGLGTSSSVIMMAKPKLVISSTLVDNGQAIPHTYVHNILPAAIGVKEGLDQTSCLNRVNDILDDRWERDWGQLLEKVGVCFTDMEIIGQQRGLDRSRALEKILRLKRWDLVVYKTYMYNASDLSNILRPILSARPNRWEIITSKLRSAHYPEVWCVLHDSEKLERPVMLTHHPSKITRQWNCILETLTSGLDMLSIPPIVKREILSMSDDTCLRRMMSYMRSWLTIPTVGLVLPDPKSHYSRVYYYFAKIKRPRYVKDQMADPKLKLYNSDYYRLRDVLLCNALALCNNPTTVLKELMESDRWYLAWEEKKGGWRCYLSKANRSMGKFAFIDDYLPLLTCYMRKVGLGYSDIGKKVVFKHKGQGGQTSSSKVWFNISKKADSPPDYLYKDSRYCADRSETKALTDKERDDARRRAKTRLLRHRR